MTVVPVFIHYPLKTLGGIKGIANSSQNLDEYFLSAAKMSNIITAFCDRFGISEGQTYKREDHYQLSGLKNKRYRHMARKISEVLLIIDLIIDLMLLIQLVIENDFVIVFERTCFTDLPDLDGNLKIYGKEEADTGIVLHAMDVCSRDTFSGLMISCSDTDVMLIRLNYFEQLPSTTVSKTTEHV